MASVYAAVTTGKLRKLGRAQHAAWKMKLLKATGCVEPVRVEARPAPSGLRPLALKLYNGYLAALSLHWALDKPGIPIPFTWQFAAASCDCSERHIGEAMGLLLDKELIHVAGRAPCAFGKDMALFLPGPEPSLPRPPLSSKRRPNKEYARPYQPWGGLTNARSIA